MDESLIRNWNARVKPEDTVFHLGDFCYGRQNPKLFRGLLNGNIIFIRGNHDCFSKDTRLLTIYGYKTYDQLKIGDLIPTLNNDTHTVEIQPIEDITVNFINKAYSFKNQTSEGIFSDNHKLLYSACIKKNRIYKDTTSNLWKRKSFINLISSHKSNNNEYEISDNELKLIAWIFTDGGVSIQNYISIYQSKPKYIKEIEDLLNKMDMKYTKREVKKKTLEINNKIIKNQLVSFVFYVKAEYSLPFCKKYCINLQKQIPSWMYNLSDRQMKIFIDELMKGDGSINGSGTNILYGKKELLEQIQGLCVTHGIDCNLIEQKTRRNCYYLSIRKYKDRLFSTREINTKYCSITNYNNIMWCVTVKNHNIFVELNGKPLITGNSNNGVDTPIENMTIKYGGKTIYMTHISNDIKSLPLEVDLVLCGHVHKNWKHKYVTFNRNFYDGYQNNINNVPVPVVNVGVDVWNYHPVSINEILKYLIKNPLSD